MRGYVMSAKLSPERFQHAVRDHWLIGNSLHRVLDATMNEDRQRNRMERGPENLALIRRMALNVARIDAGKDSCAARSNAPDGTTTSSSQHSNVKSS